MFLVEVHNNSGKLVKRRIADNLSKIDDWVENVLVKKWCPYDNDHRLHIAMDDYGCGQVTYHPSDYESEVVFTINTVNIGVI